MKKNKSYPLSRKFPSCTIVRGMMLSAGPSQPAHGWPGQEQTLSAIRKFPPFHFAAFFFLIPSEFISAACPFIQTSDLALTWLIYSNVNDSRLWPSLFLIHIKQLDFVLVSEFVNVHLNMKLLRAELGQPRGNAHFLGNDQHVIRFHLSCLSEASRAHWAHPCTGQEWGSSGMLTTMDQRSWEWRSMGEWEGKAYPW